MGFLLGTEMDMYREHDPEKGQGVIHIHVDTRPLLQVHKPGRTSGYPVIPSPQDQKTTLE